jgi:bla regulator protein BlaR1
MMTWLSSIGPAVGNHLWQSTAFVGVVWVATLLLRKNHARVRYGLWLAASMKLLIPFSLLFGLGSLLPRPQHAVVTMPVFSAMDEAAQPFTDVRAEAAPPTVHPSPMQQFVHALPAVLAGAWLCGVGVVLVVWGMRWRQVAKTLQQAGRAADGREWEALRRLQGVIGAGRQIPLMMSQELMEPGIFGIRRLHLIWPERLSERLDDEHIEAILAHELMHARRRDNLTAALHMVVETAFWFHPAVWWMERRMVEERERACDEAVVGMGSKPEIYAESLLKACRFCVESPMVCVAGITGADLNRRVRSIMALRLVRLTFTRKLMLASLAFAAVAAPIALGIVRVAPIYGQIVQASGSLPSFEVASIRPAHSGSGFSTTGAGLLSGPRGPAIPKDRFIATNATVKNLIQWAWAPGGSPPLPNDQVSGGPSWIDSDRYDIDAKLGDSQIAALEKLAPRDCSAQIKLMVQSLLADQFKLVVKYTTRNVSGYALVVAKGGAKLRETVPGSAPPPSSAPPPGFVPPPPPPPPPPGAPPIASQGPATPPRATILGRPGEITAFAEPVSALARSLQNQLGSPVLDQTGLKGNYSFTLRWTPEVKVLGATPAPPPGAETVPTDASGPSIFTAVQEQLGLKLESTKGGEEAITIVHLEKPTPN